MSDLDDIWQRMARRAGIAERRPGFGFDPDFYARAYPELADELDGDEATLRRDFEGPGRAAGRHGTLYAQQRALAPHIDKALAALVTDPQLSAAIAAGRPGALELAFELISLGGPVDAAISDFSSRAYLDWYPDIARAQMSPLVHYLRFGAVEGGRRTLGDLRRALHPGGREMRPDWPTLMLCLPDTAPGEPLRLALELIAEASRSHNVAVAALAGGDGMDGGGLARLLPDCCAVLLTAQPLREMPYLEAPLFDRIDLGVLVSVHAALFVHPLVARDLPFVSYVLEDPELGCPSWKPMTVAAFSDLLVFPSEHLRRRWSGRLADLEFDVAGDSAVIAPRPLRAGGIPEARRDAARAALSRALGRDLAGLRLVCGLGPVGWQAGTDLFAQAARIAQAEAPGTVFVWMGDGRNHQDAGFGGWLDHELQLAGEGRRDGNLHLLPAGPLEAELIDAADALLLSARLDPLPGQVFDMVARGGHVVCFKGATGFAEPPHAVPALAAAPGRIRTVPAGDVRAALRALMALPRKQPGDGEAGPEAASSLPLMDRLRAALAARLARQRRFVIGESAIDIPLLFTRAEADRPLRRREREKLMRYGRRLLWRDPEEAQAVLEASDNWVHRRLRLDAFRALPALARDIPDYAIHVHAYYLDDLAADLRHAAFARARRVLVTTDTEAKAEAIRRMGAGQGLSLQTQLVPNRGRDILPFLQLFAPGGLAGEDRIWCHLHQKRSLRAEAHGDVWRRFLQRVLLGDETSLSSAMAQIARPEVGLACAFDPHFVPWAESRRLLDWVAERLPGPLPDNPLLFPVGNMFWIRAEVAQAMLALIGPDHPWPNEPLPTDGTVFHLIERLWPTVAAQQGLDAVFLHKMDEARV